MGELGFAQPPATLLREDNMAVVKMSNNQKTSQWRSIKYLSIRDKFLLDHTASGMLKVQYVSSESNVADILTKPLGRERFQILRSAMGVM